MKIKDSTLTVYVKDMDKSITFYTSIGFTLGQRWDNHYAEIMAPGLKIGLHPTKDRNLTGGSGNVFIGFTTEDFDGTRNTLKGLSIKVSERAEEGGHFLHFTDPDGTSLYVIKPKW
ncbi:MAG: VOC family protein [Bacteroidales bacterium]|nr:VOC family protein [Bacteroidales bacterium]MCF8404583.1 VOC family protein [Bacteroidales bacterium]